MMHGCTTEPCDLTDAQLHYLDAVEDLRMELGRAPKQRELAGRLGRSQASVCQMLNTLNNRGAIDRSRNRACGVHITDAGKLALAEWRDAHD